ncbi:MAG: HD domain-containing phosphohydrolase [Syntrophomonadaceae bacterium]|jgi:putative two-component system response regulator
MISPRELKIAARGISTLYVEDDQELRQNTVRLLGNFFSTIDSAENGLEGLQMYQRKDYDLILTDINMPIMNGLKLAQQIRRINPKQVIIAISAHDEARYLLELINLGVDYFVLKPLDIKHFLVVLDKAISLSRFIKMENDYKERLEDTVAKRTHELSEALSIVNELSAELVHRLTSAAELRDSETGMHNKRLGLYAPLLARELDMPDDFIECIAFAAPLHDIGKIGIWDNILLKPGPLTKEEFEVMKTHTIIGASILANSKYDKIRMTESISLNHHERWDGTGYPHGLKGEDIPIEGRIVAICDHYDALRSKRPYKPAFTHHRTVEVITRGDGRTRPEYFDPSVLSAFCRVADQFDYIFTNNQ